MRSADVTEYVRTESDPGMAGGKYSAALHVVTDVVHCAGLYSLSEIMYVFTYVVHCDRDKLFPVSLISLSLKDALKNLIFIFYPLIFLIFLTFSQIQYL